MSASILICDDDAAIRMVVTQALRRAGHRVTAAASLGELRRELAAARPDVLVTDVVLPDGNGLDFVATFTGEMPDVPVIVLSAQNTLSTAVRATEAGAFDYLPKPFDLDALTATVASALARGRRLVDDLPASEEQAVALIGRSPAMQDVYRVIARVVSNELTVLITGESGTGKELVAQAIHDLGPRRRAPFVAINMAAIPRELIEAELFGHEKGAFTGAAARVAGKFEQASGGTLFLDEIGDMPMEAQTRLLRVLQSGEFTTVGGARAIRADVRIVAATNKDLRTLINQGMFREDLFYRLNVVPLRLPALRERSEDVPDLVRHFFKLGEAEGLQSKRISTAGLDLMKRYPWPGNVRELENLVRRLAALYPQDEISAEVIENELQTAGRSPSSPENSLVPENLTIGQAVEHYLQRYFTSFGEELPPSGLYQRILAEVEYPLVLASMTATRGNQIRAAELLGLNRNTLRKKIRELGVNVYRTSRGS